MTNSITAAAQAVLDVTGTTSSAAARSSQVGNASAGDLPALTILAPNFSYTLTGQDYLTLGRSIEHESRADVAEILWTYAQRYVALGGPAGRFPTLSAMVTAHSQPINPRWFPDGDKCRPGGPYHGRRECENAAARPGYAREPWSALSRTVREGILAWARGEIPNPVPRSINFAADSLIAEQFARGNTAQREVVKDGANTFVSEPVSRAWPSDNYVRVRTDSGRIVHAVDVASPGELVVLVVGGTMLLGALAVAFARGLLPR